MMGSCLLCQGGDLTAERSCQRVVNENAELGVKGTLMGAFEFGL